MKTALGPAAFLLAAVLLQGVLSGAAGGAFVDLVLVAVVAVGLRHGRVAGLASGAITGLLQDALGGGILGLSGLGKSVAGYLAGVAATQFIVAGAAARGLVFAGGTLVSAAGFIGLSVLLGLRRYDHPLLEAGSQAIANAAAGVLLLAAGDFAPSVKRWAEAAAERRRKRRSFR
ncbi:MAG TPA: rod shape-determining protein MreD [Vicinamibacterales bacterium]|nr:rod shape-determining protein MreD [Vicinamibacterales bacterium]